METKKYSKTSNAVFSLFYHLIVVVKYRRKFFLNPELVSFLKDTIIEISSKNEVEIIEQECDSDHIHILFKSKPTLDITKYINTLKGVSSRKIREAHKDFLQDKLWGDHFWSPSYFLATSGNVSLEILKNYIETQNENI